MDNSVVIVGGEAEVEVEFGIKGINGGGKKRTALSIQQINSINSQYNILKYKIKVNSFAHTY